MLVMMLPSYAGDGATDSVLAIARRGAAIDRQGAKSHQAAPASPLLGEQLRPPK
jgi:hypothetical protein